MKKFLQALYVLAFFGFLSILLKLNQQIREGTFDITSMETVELFIFLIIVIAIFIIFRLFFFGEEK